MESSWQGQLLPCPRLYCVNPSRSHQEHQTGRKVGEEGRERETIVAWQWETETDWPFPLSFFGWIYAWLRKRKDILKFAEKIVSPAFTLLHILFKNIFIYPLAWRWIYAMAGLCPPKNVKQYCITSGRIWVTGTGLVWQVENVLCVGCCGLLPKQEQGQGQGYGRFEPSMGHGRWWSFLNGLLKKFAALLPAHCYVYPRV